MSGIGETNGAGGDGGVVSSGGAGGGAASGNASGGAAGNPAPGAGAQGVGGGAGGAASWRDSLPSDLKDNPTLSKFSDIGNLGKAYIELQKKIGEKGIFKPAPTASPEERRAFHEALGVPTEDKYALGEMKGVTFPKESLEWAKKTGFKHGITPDTMTELMLEYGQFELAGKTADATKKQEDVKAGLDGLKKEWGAGYDTEVKKADFVAKEMGKDFWEYLGKSGLGNDPMVIKALARASKWLGESKLKEGNIGDGGQTPEQIQTEISSVRGQLLSMDKNDGRRPGLMARMESLYKQSTGGR